MASLNALSTGSVEGEGHGQVADHDMEFQYEKSRAKTNIHAHAAGALALSGLLDRSGSRGAYRRSTHRIGCTIAGSQWQRELHRNAQQAILSQRSSGEQRRSNL